MTAIFDLSYLKRIRWTLVLILHTVENPPQHFRNAIWASIFAHFVWNFLTNCKKYWGYCMYDAHFLWNLYPMILVITKNFQTFRAYSALISTYLTKQKITTGNCHSRNFTLDYSSTCQIPFNVHKCLLYTKKINECF